MKDYLSYGGGVDSTALMLYLKYVEKISFEAIFVDTGCEKPETIDYVKMINTKVHPVTTLIPNFEGSQSLYDHCKKKNIIPSMCNRWCTGKAKISTMRKYMERPCNVHIGIGWYEKERIAEKTFPKGITPKYILEREGYTRQDCISLIQDYKLPVPIKSSCFICPFMKKKEVRQLWVNHPDLVMQASELEKTCKYDTYIVGHKPILSYVPYKTRRLIECEN